MTMQHGSRTRGRIGDAGGGDGRRVPRITPFKGGDTFEPMLIQNQRVTVHKDAEEVGVIVEAVGALPSHIHDQGLLTTSSIAQEVTAIQMGNGMMGQLRILIRGDFELEMTHPDTSVRQWRSKSTNWRLRRLPADSSSWGMREKSHWIMSEIWVYEDETPRFDFYPLSSAREVHAYVEFTGYRYRISKMDAGERGDVHIWANGWPGGG